MNLESRVDTGWVWPDRAEGNVVNYNVFKDKDTGRWTAKRQGADRVSGVADTLKEVERLTKD